jgi:hypothetical protein
MDNAAQGLSIPESFCKHLVELECFGPSQDLSPFAIKTQKESVEITKNM